MNKPENIPALMELIILFLFLYFHSIILNTLKEDFHTKISNLDNKNQYGRKSMRRVAAKPGTNSQLCHLLDPGQKSLHLTLHFMTCMRQCMKLCT